MKRLAQLPIIVAVLAVATMIAATLADVIGRNLFGWSLPGTYEVVQISLCVAIFFAIGPVTRDGAHIVVDLIDLAIGGRGRLALQCVASMAIALLFGLLLFASRQQVDTVVRYGEMTSDLGLSKLVFWVPIVAGLIAGAIGALWHAFASLRALIWGGRQPL